MKTETSGIMTKFKRNPVLGFLYFALGLVLITIVYFLFEIYTSSQRDANLNNLASELRASSFELTLQAQKAVAGEDEAFDQLKSVVDNMSSNLQALEAADTRNELTDEIASYGAVWSKVKNNAQIIIDNEQNITFMHEVRRTLEDSLPRLQLENRNIVDILLENKAPADQVSFAQRQSWFAERIGRNIDRMLAGGEGSSEAADQFNIDANIFDQVLQGLIKGNLALDISRVTDREALNSLNEITEDFNFVSNSVREIYEARGDLFNARNAEEVIVTSAPDLQNAISKVSNTINLLPDNRRADDQAILLLIFLAALLLLGIIFFANRSSKRSLEEQIDTNDRNQAAILRLLDELADLADGDLTTTATVTEDFTGAIADSINFTVDQLRVLVSRINDTAVRVAQASAETQQTALHLAEASEHQAQEIAGASAAVNEMAVTIDQVSANAAESAGVAERSVSIANNGAKVVQNTINGMDTIREQIQDTSKRIKRLGESSQEIGDIVSLINDIADQTNILALNAAIQASMAGDAGRGFAVVADEVQRLAERSATATKQIEALVKTIQNDTNEAVTSMESTTSEVVRGARLAQDAGVALEEIESVSANLAELIQNISNAARQQASSAGHISNTMNVIQEITSQTSAGTSATARAIGNLADMAIELRESVSGFTLPEELDSANDSDDYMAAQVGNDLALGEDGVDHTLELPVNDELASATLNDDSELSLDSVDADTELAADDSSFLDDEVIDLSLDDAVDEERKYS